MFFYRWEKLGLERWGDVLKIILSWLKEEFWLKNPVLEIYKEEAINTLNFLFEAFSFHQKLYTCF